MLGELLELFKSPVTAFSKRAEERNIKKEIITTGVIAIIIALVTVLTTYFGIMKGVNKKYKSLDDYNESLYPWEEEVTKEEFKELKKEAKEEAFEDVKLVGIFFKKLATPLVAVVVIAGILFVIARMVKYPKDYIEMLAMSNCAFTIYLIGFLLNAIFSYIYVPVGIILFASALIFTVMALASAFRSNIEVEDENKLVIFSGIVLAVVVAVLVLVFKDYITGLSALNSLSTSLNSLKSLF